MHAYGRANTGQGRQDSFSFARTRAVAAPPPKTHAPSTQDYSTGLFGHDLSRIPVREKAPLTIQPKLTVGAPGDAYEREADEVAGRVVSAAPESHLQRASCACGGTCSKCGGGDAARERLQTKSVGHGEVEHAGATPVLGDVLRSTGEQLDTSTRSLMESRLGHDFGGVRVHTDARAAEAAESYNSRAFTLGRDVVFGAGQYAPKTSAGLKLLAHELTHVVQQSGGAGAHSVIQRDGGGGGTQPVVIVSGPAAIPKLAEDAAEKNIRGAGAKAEKAGLYRFVQTAGYADFVKNAHKVLKDKECASKVLINGHGGSSATSAWMTMGSSKDPKRGWGTTDIGNNSGTLVGDDVFKNIKFCKPCEVWLGGCDFAANKPGIAFMQTVANATGCTAKAYATEVTTNPDTGWIEAAHAGGKKKKAPPTP
jgi:hypothetical protein